jgi:hypothetical protein
MESDSGLFVGKGDDLGPVIEQKAGPWHVGWWGIGLIEQDRDPPWPGAVCLAGKGKRDPTGAGVVGKLGQGARARPRPNELATISSRRQESNGGRTRRAVLSKSCSAALRTTGSASMNAAVPLWASALVNSAGAGTSNSGAKGSSAPHTISNTSRAAPRRKRESLACSGFAASVRTAPDRVTRRAASATTLTACAMSFCRAARSCPKEEIG